MVKHHKSVETDDFEHFRLRQTNGFFYRYTHILLLRSNLYDQNFNLTKTNLMTQEILSFV